MKRLLLILTAISLVCGIPFVVLADDKSPKEIACELARKDCTQDHLIRNTSNITMVSPRGHKICWEGFHKCMGN